MNYYCRAAPVITAPPGEYEWLNHCMFLASGSRGPNDVKLSVWSVT